MEVQLYLSRYNKLVAACNTNRTLVGYTERHHIIPRCIGGKDTIDNLVELTMREHFLAHWMLWKAYPKNASLKSAFLQMINKNPKSKKPYQGRVTSKVYAKLKEEFYTAQSQRLKGKVYVRTDSGLKHITSEEYKSGNYKFHTAGKVYAYDTVNNEWRYITSDEYKSVESRYVCRLTDISKRSDFDQIKHIFDQSLYKIPEFEFTNTETGETVRLTKPDAAKLNALAGYKKFKNLQKKTVTCVDPSNTRYRVPLGVYDLSLHKSVLADTLVVVDTTTGLSKSIKLSEYRLNPTRYLTSTKGKVLAKDTTGKNILVSKEEFSLGNFVGQTKGLTTVLDKISGEYVQLTREEFRKNKGRYQGPSSGKVNVIDILTGCRQQILKAQFDKTRFLSLGNKKFLFKCRNLLTNKEKYVNIYEWKIVFNQYTIIEKEKFNTLTDYIQ